MTSREFIAADAGQFDGALLALWWAAQGNWEQAHAVAQDVETLDGAWVHAYLHRKEGDVMNATYWYRRARLPVEKAIWTKSGSVWWRRFWRGHDSAMNLAL
jgi:hypothetical protein